MTEAVFVTLLDAIEYHAATRSSERALTFLKNGETESGAQIWSRVPELARGFAAELAERAKPGDRVLILLPTGIEFPIAFLGCLYAGVIAVPANIATREHEERRTREIIRDCSPVLIIADEKSDDCDVPVWRPDDFENLTDPNESFVVDPDSIAFLQYTSGSTRAPRGVRISHRNVLANLQMHRDAFATGTESVFVNWCPLFHDLGLITMLLHSLYVGGHFIGMSPASFIRKPSRWLRAVSDYRGTMIIGPNFGYEQLLKSGQQSSYDLSSLRVASSAAEPILAETIEAIGRRFAAEGLRRDALTCSYGLAEATVYVTSGQTDVAPTILDADAFVLHNGTYIPATAESVEITRVVGVGHAVPPGKVMIADSESFVRKPENTVGEILVCGPHVSSGYWNVDHSNFLKDEWLPTGDLGFLHRGELFVCGRLKETIVIRGRNYYPQDIEAAILEQGFSGIKSRGVVGFGIQRNNAEEELVLVIETAVDRSFKLLADQVRKYVAEELRLSVGEILFVRRGTITRTTSGKLERNALRDRFRSGDLVEAVFFRNEKASVEFSKPVGRIESLFASELGIPAVDPTVSLFQYGVDSLGFARIVARLEDELERPIPYERWAIDPSADHLLALLDGSNSASMPTTKVMRSISFLSRLRRKIFEIGPVFRGKALFSHPIGTHLQRAILQYPLMQRLVLGNCRDQLLLLLTESEASPTECEDVIRCNSIVNSWTVWRSTLLRESGAFDRLVEIVGNEPSESDGPIVLACTHSGGLTAAIFAWLERTKRDHIVIGHFRDQGLRLMGLNQLADEVAAHQTLPDLAIRSAQVVAAERCLEKSGIVVIFVDAAMGRDGVEAIIGRRRRTIRPGMARLALEHRAKVVPLSVDLTDEGAVRLEFHPRLELQSPASSGKDAEAQILRQYADHSGANATTYYRTMEEFVVDQLRDG